LTDLLKKNAFHWTPAVEKAFTELNRAMHTTLVLAMPDFNKTFVVELDASVTIIGVFLTQDGIPFAFTIQPLSGCNLGIYTYEKEMMVILHVVHRWWAYLLGHRF